ncbi:MAG: hypothetical protein AB9880_09180 [Christensenellales bacterium]
MARNIENTSIPPQNHSSAVAQNSKDTLQQHIPGPGELLERTKPIIPFSPQEAISKEIVQRKRTVTIHSSPSDIEPDQIMQVTSAEPSHMDRQQTRQRVVSSRTQRPVRAAEARRETTSSVYVGLDFGTTFTKAAYEIAPSNVHTKYSVCFENVGAPDRHYLPSVVYFDPQAEELSIRRDCDSCVEVRYFKYNMISDALKKNAVLNDPSVVTKNSKEQLCSIFFISYVIALVRAAVLENDHARNVNSDSKWFINMGVPLKAHKSEAEAAIYKRVLETAYRFEKEFNGITCVNIHELDDFYGKHKSDPVDTMNTLPEIYAEVLLYQQYLNTPAGFYTVIDIGGGTEDIATFLKTSNGYGETVDCLSHGVIGYGFEAISERIAANPDEVFVSKAKEFLSRTDVNFNADNELREKIPMGLWLGALIDSRLKCRTLVGACLQSARRKREDILEETVREGLPMFIFIMGGANSVQFYLASIEHMEKAQKNAGFPFFKYGDVIDYLKENVLLEVRNDQRLIISQMLAQPYEMIPEIDNMPWDIREKKKEKTAPTRWDLQALQDEMYPE